MRYVVGSIGAFIAVIALLAVFGSWYTVDQGEEAVLLTTGAISGTEGPGLHFKTPFFQSVQKITLQSHVENFEAASMESYSKDQQPANVNLSVNYHVVPGKGAELYAEYGSFDNMIAREIRQKVPAIFKNVFGTYDAQTAIQQRARLNAEVLEALQASIQGPVAIESVQVKDVKFSPDYEAAIAAKQTATVEVQRKQQELAQKKVEAEITVTNAKAQADSNLAVAKAAAEAVRIQGEAEAAAIKAKAQALNDNPGLVALTKAERWDGKLPTTVLPNDVVPFIDAVTED